MTSCLVLSKLAMCPIPSYRLQLLTPEGKDAVRAVAILISSDGKVGANAAFDRLDRKEKAWFHVSFDYWRANQVGNNRRYHGWTKSQFQGKYCGCFVFKHSQLRLYGFLYHPIKTNPRFEVCVLIHPAYKDRDETDPADLERTLQTGTKPEVVNAIEDHFRR